jgi:tetratricopeptide (TPR) repeat protein
MLRGELQDALGFPDQALVSYAAGVSVTARLLGQLAALRQRRGLLFQHRRELQASWQEIHCAEFDLEVLRGLVREEEGDYSTALEAYQRARALAEQLDDDALRAQSERWIAAVYGRRQQLEEAVTHAARSIAIYQRIGDRVNLEKMRGNLAFIYVQTRQFRAALDVGVPAYAFFLAIRDPHYAAGAGANLAEASYELGDFESAARYAAEVLELGDRFAAPYVRFTLGQIDLAQHNPPAAIANFSTSMQIAQQNDDPFMVAYAQRSLGQAQLAAGAVATARQQIESALALFRQLDIPGEIAATEQLLDEMNP